MQRRATRYADSLSRYIELKDSIEPQRMAGHGTAQKCK